MSFGCRLVQFKITPLGNAGNVLPRAKLVSVDNWRQSTCATKLDKPINRIELRNVGSAVFRHELKTSTPNSGYREKNKSNTAQQEQQEQ